MQATRSTAADPDEIIHIANLSDGLMLGSVSFEYFTSYRYIDYTSDEFLANDYDYLIRVITHELLHNLGVNHCDGSQSCIMSGKTDAITQNLLICDTCREWIEVYIAYLYNH